MSNIQRGEVNYEEFPEGCFSPMGEELISKPVTPACAKGLHVCQVFWKKSTKPVTTTLVGNVVSDRRKYAICNNCGVRIDYKSRAEIEAGWDEAFKKGLLP